MRVSKVLGNTDARAVNVASIEDLARVVTHSTYSLATFKDGHRHAESFEQAAFIGLDFDEGLSLEDAKRLFADYRHIIATTRSHQKEKNGVVCDRFRVILQLDTPITDAATFSATYQALREAYPQLDPACAEPARQFYASPKVASINAQGRAVGVVAPKPRLEVVKPVALPEGTHGKLAYTTCQFLIEGAPKGHRHNAVYRAARDAHQNGYTAEWFKSQLLALAERTGVGNYIDEGAMKTVDDAFSKEPRHEPRVEERAFSYMSLGDLFSRKTEVEWVVEKLLTKGGLSLVAGPPKSGKSTLVRQLVTEVIRGGTFLDRKCVQGDVLYFALEEQAEVLAQDFKRLGLTAKDPLSIHIGSALSARSFEHFTEDLETRKPTVAVIDTLFLFLPVKSEKEYSEVNAGMARIRKAARDSGTHIVLIHHTSKPMPGQGPRGANAILGSTAIHGAVDSVLVMENSGKDRILNTSLRVGRPIRDRVLVYDDKAHTYSLGPEVEF